MRGEKMKTIDFVFIDDNKPFANALCVSSKERGLKADAYNNADDFLNNLHKYPKDTKIVVDYDLKQKENGLDLLEKLHEAEYSKLYLMSGKNFEQEIPFHITVFLKNAQNIEELLASV
jgi:ActR/RegA family two-component response regulator